MVEEAERVEREEGARVRSEIVEALVGSTCCFTYVPSTDWRWENKLTGYSQAGGSKQMADDIKTRGDRAKAARAEALAQAIPPSLAVFYQNLPLSTEVDHSPLSPSYAGPYVAIPYSDPDLAAWKKWYEMKEDYVDGRSGVIWVKEDKEGKVRGGGYDLNLFWEMEVRCAVEALGVKPIGEKGDDLDLDCI